MQEAVDRNNIIIIILIRRSDRTDDANGSFRTADQVHIGRRLTIIQRGYNY